MRFLRFLFKELIIHGIIFALIGTVVLSSLYLVATGQDEDANKSKTSVSVQAEGEAEVLETEVPNESSEAVVQLTDTSSEKSIWTTNRYLKALKGFGLFLTGQVNTSKVGWSSGAIIRSGAAVTLPLALIALLVIVLIAVICSSYAVTTRYMAIHFENKSYGYFEKLINAISAVLAAIPLFVGLMVVYAVAGRYCPLPVVALVTVIFGGLSWDATNFLKTDMLSQINQTHAIVFSTLGRSMGKFFPSSGTYSGYIFQASLPRFIPYVAGKVPAIIGSITIAEIAFSFPGLGKTLIDAMKALNGTDTLVASVFVLLCVNAFVSLIVKGILFLFYPRWYEKAI
ncbi:MAG: ABC transporter permease subunit [Treponema sp.]|nr:ABC transporter permease subunit [Treponema sp.]